MIELGDQKGLDRFRARQPRREPQREGQVSSNSPRPTIVVTASRRTSGAVRVSSAMPAATAQPVMSERVKTVSSGTPSSETVGSFASSLLNNSASKDGEARWPSVLSGFGMRAKLTPLRSKNENVQSGPGRWRSMIRWKPSSGGLKEMS